MGYIIVTHRDVAMQILLFGRVTITETERKRGGHDIGGIEQALVDQSGLPLLAPTDGHYPATKVSPHATVA